MKASKYYSEWMGQGSIKQRKSLRNVKKMCDELEKEQVLILGSIVGRLCKENFGTPSYGSMKNNQVLMEYVKIRGIEQEILDGGLNIGHEGLRLENKVLRKFISDHIGIEKLMAGNLGME